MSSTEKFLNHFQGRHIFATVNDKKSGGFFHYHSDLETAKPYLNRDNKQGRGIFFCVNELDRSLDPTKKRTKKMFVRVRAIWVEDDNPVDNPRNDWPLKPNLIVNSSPGKYHYYWLTDTTDREEWEELMQVMCDSFGSDNNAKDIARVLRLPGFDHHKKDPYRSKFRTIRSEPYEWEALRLAFMGDAANRPKPEKPKSKPKTSDKVKPIKEHVKDSDEGHRHGPSMSIAMSLANRGVPKEDILAILEKFPEYNEGDHLHSVETAIEKIQAETATPDGPVVIPELQSEENALPDFTWPPGQFGDMCKQCYEMAHYPYRGVAIATSVGILAALCGRTYNISDLGLNIYISLLMDTGMGKDMIRKIINRTFMTLDPLNGNKFVGPARFTGVPALWRTMMDSMCRVSVITEAGFLNGADIGDKSGLSATLLSMYGSSGKYDVQNANEYSSKENSLPDLHSPSLSVLQESTPKSFVEAMLRNDGDINGDLARMWLLRLDQSKPYRNRKPRQDFEASIKKRLKELLSHALDFLQNETISRKTKDLEIPDWLDEESDIFVDREEEARRTNRNYQKVMLSRGWVKATKISALIAIFNGEKTVTKEIYDWVKSQVIERELGTIEKTISKDDTRNIPNVVNHISIKIAGLLKDPDKARLNYQLADHGIFTLSSLYLLTNHDHMIRSLSSRQDSAAAKDGLEKIIDNMERRGLLRKLRNDDLKKISPRCRAAFAYQITDDFNLMLTSS